MATSLLLLLDDITSVLDDVATMTKVAAKKTAGVLGDDLALNAKQVTGVHPDRELAVVWAVARGSLLNKLVLIPAAVAISGVAPWVIPWLLVAGGSFLCYEGMEKIVHSLHRRQQATPSIEPSNDASSLPAANMEAAKIRGAVRTDFILSAEIVVITLGVVADKTLATKFGVLAAIGLAMTIGVYGVVAAIVKLDDFGRYLLSTRSAAAGMLGRGLLLSMPWLMRALSVGGTVAMFLVGGGIISHEVPWVHHHVEELRQMLVEWLGDGSAAAAGGLLLEAGLGILVGTLVLAGVATAGRLRSVVWPRSHD